MTAAKLADTSDPRFTDDQRAAVARFEAAPTPPEIVEARVVEEVARAIYEEQGCRVSWHRLTDPEKNDYRTLAAAAVAAYRAAQDGGAEEAVRRVEAVAEWCEQQAESRSHFVKVDPGYRDTIIGYEAAAERIRAALAPQAGDGAR